MQKHLQEKYLYEVVMDQEQEFQALDADELMGISERIGHLPPEDAEWVGRLFRECMRARMCEAERLENQSEENAPVAGTPAFDAQLAQVALDAAEWLRTLWEVGYMGADNFPVQPRTAFPVISLEDVLKSSLFARIREGKRPLPFPPPTRNGLPWHDLIEGPPESQVVHAELVEDGSGEMIGAIVEGCADWQIIQEVDKGSEYLIQYRGKGPLFQLNVNPFFSTLQRQLPQWERRIRVQERVGVRSYLLVWPSASGVAREVPLPATTWERAESEAAYWVATNHPEMYGRIRFRQDTAI
ncbi:MAG: hypothetical protein LBD06_09370 [Candidatus Accumulibacter sp.]|jgi:hypothetical protein|nr:hypothetical protein [Accumulibacter sp.]